MVARQSHKLEVVISGSSPTSATKQAQSIMKVSVIGAGNVGVAIAADLSIKGHEVTLIKSSDLKSKSFDRLIENGNRVFLKENGEYTGTVIKEVSRDLGKVADSQVVFVTIQSNYHEELYKKISGFLNENQVIVCICSYMSLFYLYRHCSPLPMMAETTGPYLEGRIELDDKLGEVVFRVGCRLTRSPLSVFYRHRKDECMKIIHELYNGFSCDYDVVESALLNPNMVLHTVGAIMSIPRIEFSDGNFCMYREAYTKKNEATIRIMLALDQEKKDVLTRLGFRPTDIMEAGGFLKGMESFYEYSESEDRAISPTSVRSRYITEDVSQGLVLLESIAEHKGVPTPITTSLIDIAGTALDIDFRRTGRTLQRLGAVQFIKHLGD